MQLLEKGAFQMWGTDDADWWVGRQNVKQFAGQIDDPTLRPRMGPLRANLGRESISVNVSGNLDEFKQGSADVGRLAAAKTVDVNSRDLGRSDRRLGHAGTDESVVHIIR